MARICVRLAPLPQVFRHAGDQILRTCLARASRLRKLLDMGGSLLYHAAPARLPCGRLRCRHTHRSDYSALSLPPLTVPWPTMAAKDYAVLHSTASSILTAPTLYATALGHTGWLCERATRVQYIMQRPHWPCGTATTDRAQRVMPGGCRFCTASWYVLVTTPPLTKEKQDG